jgi:integrase
MAKKRGNGEGSVFKRKDGRWEGRYTARTLKGPKQQSVYGKTRAETSEKLRRTMSDLDNGLLVDTGNLTVGEYLDRWLSDCEEPLVKQGQMAYSTYSRYAGIVKNHLKPALGTKKLKDLKRTEVRAFYRDKFEEGASSRSVDYIHVTLQKALQQAERDDLVVKNVASGERPRSSRNKKEVRAFSRNQVRLLLDAASGCQNEALYVVAAHTGLRRGELLGLKWEDVEVTSDKGRISVRRALKVTRDGLGFGPPKNKTSRRLMPLNATAASALRIHRKQQSRQKLRASEWADHDLVFPNRNGKPMDPNNFYHREYKPLLKRAGLDNQGFTFHTLRHSFATELFTQGKYPKQIQTLLGHSSITQTIDTYSHLIEGIEGDTVDGLDSAFG